VNTAVASTSKKVKAGASISVTWYGNNLGTLSRSALNQVKASSGSATTIGVGKVSYDTEFDRWKLTPPSGMPTEYAIIVLITVTS